MKINLVNDFIRLSKYLRKVLNLLIKKPNESFKLSIDYQAPNNWIIKNQYLLLLINEFLNQLEKAKKFILFELTKIYY